jgi:hypothetical protein
MGCVHVAHKQVEVAGVCGDQLLNLLLHACPAGLRFIVVA